MVNLYEMIERSLDYRWFRGAYRLHFDAHIWPRTGFYARPWLTMISPHEGAYSVFDGREGKTYTVTADEVVFTPALVPIRVRQHAPGTQTYAHIRYSILGAFDPFALFTLPRTYKREKGELLREALLACAHAQVRPAASLADAGARRERAFRLFNVLLSLGTLKPDRTGMLAGLSRIQPVIEFVRQNLHEPVSGAELGRLVNLSQSRFNAVFRGIMGTPPGQYVLEERQKRAAELLQTTELSIGGIAERCGFCDQFEFSRRFKKRWGVPPFAYRQELRRQMAGEKQVRDGVVPD